MSRLFRCRFGKFLQIFLSFALNQVDVLHCVLCSITTDALLDLGGSGDSWNNVIVLKVREILQSSSVKP